MSLIRSLKIMKKDFRLGPRSPIFLFALVMPVAMTLILQLSFGSLFEPKPRMAIVDEGDSAITVAMQETEGIEVTILEDGQEMKDQVESNDYDTGLYLPAGFDEAVEDGEKPELQLYIGGESLASNRLILAVTTTDLVREVEGSTPPIEVKVVSFGEEVLPIDVRLVPMVMMYALIIAGLYVPASSLVEEKERGTFTAMVVTPVRTPDIMFAKLVLGTVLAFLMAIVTLVINRAVGSNPVDLVVVLFVGALYCGMWGLVFGAVSKDSTVLYSLIKGLGLFLFAPVIFYLFPNWPQWIAKLFPTYWIIEPIFQVSIMGARLADVWLEIVVSAAIIIALIPLIMVLSRRMVDKIIVQ